MYFAITLDRTTAGPLIIACREGGTSIEDLAEKFPDMIVKVPIDVFKGITDEDAAKVVDGLAPKVADRNASIVDRKAYNNVLTGKIVFWANIVFFFFFFRAWVEQLERWLDLTLIWSFYLGQQ